MEKKKKLSLLQALVDKKMLICLLNGFTAGLPIYFLLQLIPAWLKAENVDLKTIGFFGFVLVPYSFKYLWAPFVDRYVPPFLGRRRGWMLITQILILVFMCYLGFLKPQVDIDLILYVGLAIAFFSATQDIVLDSYRRELLPDEELGLGNSYYANAYRIAGFIPGGLGLILADYLSWPIVFSIVASFMLVGVFHTLWIQELVNEDETPKTLKEAVVTPFIEFFKRGGTKHALLIIFFIFFYKFGDTVATALITPFYLDVGFSMTVIGGVVKAVAVWSMLIGGFIGGAIMFKLGINKSLWFFGIVQLLSILGFALLNEVGTNTYVLGAVVAFEYLGVGLGSAALMAFIASNTNKSFTGTQLALLSSIFAIPKSFAGVIAGVIIEGVKPNDELFYDLLGAMPGLGYTKFFLICTLLALPGMILLFWVAPLHKKAN
ncbi:MAG: AmpG family muropeptide MFS transporter [Bacteriovoracaceae bacterium]|jgi:PAT family beta-lactamase induction signal transducer AmpG|nr:AmpG family muropeptide MFS transporter [Bacteriovoracaceae bacterium]